ncbi:MAG: YggS family pyridoxal phosphate-dependent enzyme, partial [Nitrospinaceae bacterium]|nr:YggS family pyridoxal phosphate-dependent enzyme [Nitrospinaceae bacterium]NIR56570.1 YggS family pyridoxal phosphate-dependent enzyme [Nitrospinaceae bacterium]NIS87032.1 YggS family pyridoxal phosphate-dependent enzyme [Nitrospinaceae bacterium]NIT83876.1 YggS family pyridoxal phosphate-dependent enzyme [Nitrospinaceae bacterium]NIU46079.1 YggS family pyridoxal phosphate-dependent enzyme [Nitrospinaceae bacterium]
MDIAARKGGRNPETVRLIAVTKTVPVEQIREASRAGARCFGENRIQEAVEKIDRLKGEDLRWHFIGHLQKNKVKFIFGRFDLIHSVDGAELAETISRKSLEHGERMPILIQVNVSGEASKFGLPPPSLESTLRAVAKLEGVQVRGLMTIPPFDPDPER